MGQCANAGNSSNNQEAMDNAVTTSVSMKEEKEDSSEPLISAYRSTLHPGTSLKRSKLGSSSEPPLPVNLISIYRILTNNGSSAATFHGDGKVDGVSKFTRIYNTNVVPRIPIKNPNYTDPYSLPTNPVTVPDQYTLAVAVNYESINSTIYGTPCSIDAVYGFFIFDYTTGEDSSVKIYYSLSNIHGVTVLWSGQGVTKSTGSEGVQYDLKLTAAATSRDGNVGGSINNTNLGIVQTPHLDKRNAVYTYDNTWKLDITFYESGKFVFNRSNVPHPANITFTLGNTTSYPRYTPTYPDNVKIPDVVNSIIALLCGSADYASTKTFNGAGTDTTTNVNFTRSMTNRRGDRLIYKNPTYDGVPDQYITACSVNYTSHVSGELIDQAAGFWIFDFSDYISNPVIGNIKLYYQLSNFHGVNILYSGVLADVSSNGVTMYEGDLSAAVPSGLIQTPHLQPKNNVTNDSNPPPSSYTGNKGAWKLKVTFDITGNTFMYVRSNNPHPASIKFS